MNTIHKSAVDELVCFVPCKLLFFSRCFLHQSLSLEFWAWLLLLTSTVLFIWLRRYKKLLCMVDLTRDFYFSYSYHVMRSLQKNMCDNETGQVLYETMFVWNEFLTREMRNILQNTSWTVALVYGFFKQVSFCDCLHELLLVRFLCPSYLVYLFHNSPVLSWISLLLFALFTLIICHTFIILPAAFVASINSLMCCSLLMLDQSRLHFLYQGGNSSWL